MMDDCKAKHVPQKSISDNTINISLCGAGLESAKENKEPNGGAREIVLQPNPINLNITTDTDWPTIAVGVSTVFITIFIAYFSYRIQKIQIRANVAQVRSKWIEDLREAAAKFLETMTLIVNKREHDQNWRNTDEAHTLFSALLYAQIKLSLMLDKTKERNKEIIRASEQVIEVLQTYEAEERTNRISQIGQLGMRFEEKLSDALEHAWLDIRNDLNPKIFGRERKRPL